MLLSACLFVYLSLLPCNYIYICIISNFDAASSSLTTTSSSTTTAAAITTRTPRSALNVSLCVHKYAFLRTLLLFVGKKIPLRIYYTYEVV